MHMCSVYRRKGTTYKGIFEMAVQPPTLLFPRRTAAVFKGSFHPCIPCKARCF